MTALFLVCFPAVAGLAVLFVRQTRASLALLVFVSATHLIGTFLIWAGLPGLEFGIFLKIDTLGLLFLSILSILFFAASLFSVSYIGHAARGGADPKYYAPCLLWFLSAMTLVTVSHHLAVMWAAIEATTLASAPLVYFYKRKESLEAAWKYILICSVGIALALLGVFFLGIAAPSGSDLTLSSLMSAAPSMPRPWLKAAFVLALVGFGTKMGLAPLHTWLPDTHSQAPAPVSALLSGTLLNCALVAILRFYQVCLASGDAEFARVLLVGLGLLSIGVSCAFMFGQQDYKRLLAYSSIENMGIIVVGVGLGGAAAYGAVLHAVNHSLCKAALFFLSGNVLREYGTSDSAKVRGVLRRLPMTGVMLMSLCFALGGAPPFGPFVSEFIIFRGALVSAHPWIGILFFGLLAVAFLGMAGVFLPMLQNSSGRDEPATGSESSLSIAAPLALAAGSLMLGFYIPPHFSALLHRVAFLLGGG